MDYYESAEGLIISKKRALQELASHCVTSDEDIEFFFEWIGGERDYYDAQEVLDFLGY